MGKVIYLDETNKHFEDWRWCKKCDHLKPPRTHHCSICQACVMRMDHHCPWTGNCIGLKTHKFFMCYLLWTFLACMHVALSTSFMHGQLAFWTPIPYTRKFLKEVKPLSPILAP